MPAGISQEISPMHFTCNFPPFLKNWYFTVNFPKSDICNFTNFTGNFPIYGNFTWCHLAFHRKFPLHMSQEISPIVENVTFTYFNSVSSTGISQEISPFMETSRDVTWYFTGNFPFTYHRKFPPLSKTSVVLISIISHKNFPIENASFTYFTWYFSKLVFHKKFPPNASAPVLKKSWYRICILSK